MMYFDEMQTKYGFNDGDSMPQGIDAYRSVYVQALNHLLEQYGSSVRLEAYDRPGMHNSCLILRIPAVPPTHQDANAPEPPCDDAYYNALCDAQEMDLDDYIRVEVHIDQDSLDDFLSNLLEPEEETI
jgi:hypothetical protein